MADKLLLLITSGGLRFTIKLFLVLAVLGILLFPCISLAAQGVDSEELSVAKAASYLDAGKYKMAEDCLLPFMAANKPDPSAIALLAVVFLARAENEKALELASLAVRAAPGSYDCHCVSALVKGRCGQWRSSASEFKEAIAEFGESDAAYFGLAVSSARLGDLKTAAESYETAMRLRDGISEGGAMLLASKAITDSLLPDSSESSRTARLLMPGKPEAEFCEGASRYFGKDYEGAADFFARASAAQSGHLTSLFWQARALRMAKKASDAFAVMKKVVSEDSEDGEALEEMWKITLELNDETASAEIMKKIAAVDPPRGKKIAEKNKIKK